MMVNMMSAAAARAFLQKMEEDPDFKIRIVSMLGAGETVREYIRRCGYDFTYDDLIKITDNFHD